MEGEIFRGGLWVTPMSKAFPRSDRRLFLGVLGASLFVAPGLFAEQLLRTPSQTEGPFYPDHLPLDTDNDLIVIKDSTMSAVGEITQLTGRVLGPTGAPMKDVVVEIWQCDGNGVYNNSEDSNRNTHRSWFLRLELSAWPLCLNAKRTVRLKAIICLQNH